MNGIDKITGKIMEDTRQEIEKILANAQAEAKSIADSYAAKAENLRCNMTNAGDDQAEEIVRRAKSAAELDARQQLLASKQKMIQQAFDKALEHLLNLPDQEYVSLLGHLAAQASNTGSEIVLLSPKDQQRFGEQVIQAANQQLIASGKTGALTLSTETRPIIGGLLLKAGDIEVNCTLDSIVGLSRDDLALEVAAALFA
jgi:V/A-type H+-transporting ATPase subunit E